MRVRIFDEIAGDAPHSYRRLRADLVRHLAANGWDHDVVQPEWPVPGTRASAAHATVSAFYRQILYPLWARPRFLSEGVNLLLSGGLVHLLRLAPVDCRAVVFCHDVLPFLPFEALGHRLDFGGALRRTYLSHAQKSAFGRAAAIFAPSEATKRDLVRWAGVASERVVVTPSRVDLAAFSPGSSREARRRLGLPQEVPLALAVIAPERRKNVSGLLHAWRIVAASLPEARLLLLGHLARRDRRTLEGLGLSSGVIRRAELEPEGVVDCYRAADCLVHVSFYEGFGYPLVEAMACGCPVVCSDRGSIPEVVGDAAVVVDAFAADAIATAVHRVLVDASLRADLVARGRARAARFGAEPAYAEALRSVVGGESR